LFARYINLLWCNFNDDIYETVFKTFIKTFFITWYPVLSLQFANNGQGMVRGILCLSCKILLYNYVHFLVSLWYIMGGLIMSVTNKIQLYRLIYNSWSAIALHVSGDVFANHQEHLTVFTASCSFHPSCCRLVSWMSWNELKLQFQLIHDTSRQRLEWIPPGAVNTVKYSWWWAKTSPETCGAD
jgi:hypothetical protein